MSDKEKSAKELLLEKWEEIDGVEQKLSEIADPHRRATTAVLLENTDKMLTESAHANSASGIQNYDPVLVSLVRRLAPKLIAYDFCGVQPMTGPTGLLFALKARYADGGGDPQAGAEALGLDEANTAYSGTGSQVGDDPWDVGYATGVAKSIAATETDAFPSMGVTIEKISAIAKGRQLRADYSLELAQDLKAIHGLDADAELVNILSSELINEMNREIVRLAYAVAKPGAVSTTTAGTFDLQADSDGRWSAERFKGLFFQIEREANRIAIETKRGKGNILICSSDVASALAMAGVLDYAPALDSQINLDVDVTGTTYAGKAGRFKVYVDPYLGTDGFCVAYKGANQYDCGFFYAPYVPLQLYRATDPVDFKPALGFKTRYALVANPFTTLTGNQNTYFRKVKVTNIL